jgi:Secretion system C-terminal sorting domain
MTSRILRFRNVLRLIVVLAAFEPSSAFGQVVFLNLFYPNSTPFFAPVGTSITDTTFFFSTNGTAPALTFKGSDSEITCSAGVARLDTELNATVIPLTIIIHVARIGCYNLSVRAYSDTSFLNSFPVTGYAFDPQKIGTFHQDTNILNFGQVPVGGYSSLQEIFAVDTIGNISLFPKNVILPFSSDSFGSPPANTDLCDSVALGIWFYFHPSQSGNYTDTVYTYDPVTSDSTILILKGEGVAAGISTPIAESSHLEVFPNPSDKECSLAVNNSLIDRVTIFNSLGERLLDLSSAPSDILPINTSTFPNGIYFMEVFSNRSSYRSQMIVEH